MRSLVLKGVLTAALHVGAGLANAATITPYTTLTNWQTAAGAPIATEDFTDSTLVSGLSVNLAGGGSISGGKISSSLAVFGLCENPAPTCPATTVFSFAPGTMAFAADWDLSPGGPGNGIYFSAHLADGTIQDVSGFGGTFNGFYGFVSDTSVTSINLYSGFTGSGETFDADNVRFRTAGGTPVVPEPATVLLVGTGLIGFLRSRRHKP